MPSSIQRDLAIARLTKANILIVGPEAVVVKLLRFAVPDLTQAAIIRQLDGQLRLPPASLKVGTVVVRDVDALTPGEQRLLREWLELSGNRTQVVSTAFAPLESLVEARAFNDALYYRLNVVYIDLSA